MKSRFAPLFLLTSIAVGQAQYSPNVVGYVNKEFSPGYTFVANPLDCFPSNSLANIMHDAPDGTKVHVWDVTNQVYLPPAIYHAALQSWSLNYDLPVGKGFVVHAPLSWTNTFVGGVLQGGLTNFVAGNNKWSLLGSKVPQAGAISAVLGFPKLDGANVFFFRTATQKFSESFTCFADHGWFDPKGLYGDGGPASEVAESFLIQNPGPETNWYRFFIVPRPAPAEARRSGTALPRISQINVQKQKVVLTLPADDQAYDIQHSADGTKWQTLVRNHRGKSWNAPLPPGDGGYFQLAAPTGPEDKQ